MSRFQKIKPKLHTYPFPLIKDILALLSKARYYISLKLQSGYWQEATDEKDREKPLSSVIASN